MPERSDWLLLALDVQDGQPLTPVQIQKSMFLLGKEKKRAVGQNYYRFTPYDYGPFDATVYHDLTSLVQNGLVVRDGSGSARTYSITPRGAKEAQKIRKALSATAKDGYEYLGKAVKWAAGLTFTQLVRAIYDEYPEYRVNSIFRG